MKILYLCCMLIGLMVQPAIAQTYLATQETGDIQSITLDKKSARITMKDYAVIVPLDIMHGKDFTRAKGVTPKGMAVGLKYNGTLLQLLIVDKAQKNYMTVHFIAKNAKNIILPNNYKPPIDQDNFYISSVQFIESYPLWPANSTARGFDLLSSKERILIQLFPAIRLEIADKLCRAEIVTSGVFTLLPQSENLNCDTLKLLDNINYLNQLKKYAAAERTLLINVIECSQGVKRPNFCQNINKKLAKKVLKSVTIGKIFKNIQL